MLFNSMHFVFFFPLVVALYFATPSRYRWILLLSASYYFYMSWKPEYLLLIIVSTLIDYYAGIRMGETSDKLKRKKYLWLSVVSNLGILFGFKYFNFFNDSIREVFDYVNVFYSVPAFNVLLPVGISFYTFQTMSYSIDIYRGAREPEKHLGIFALYVSFFPQLVAGPIERSSNLLPQFKKEHAFDYDRVTSGMKTMVWGYFKKLVVADRLAIYVNAVYNHPGEYSGLSLLTATIFFAFQIYCDFSGYSDIAIGTARIMGYDLMENFRRPYFSQSIREFWSRWHISLSTWFRDYLYIPLGGNRTVKWRYYYNLFIVFLVSGLWHGASWTYVIWGALHGLYLITGLLTLEIRRKVKSALFGQRTLIPRITATSAVFSLVMVSWVFFRASTVSDAFLILSKILTFSGPLEIEEKSIFLLSLAGIAALCLIELQQELSFTKWSLFSHRSLFIRHVSYALFVIIILLIGVFDAGQFIYFQF